MKRLSDFLDSKRILHAAWKSMPVLSTGLALMLASRECAAQTTQTWNNTTNTGAFFDVESNWLSGVAPSAGDIALFNLNPGAPYQVWWDGITQTAIPEIGSVHVTAGDVSFVNVNGSPQYQLSLTGVGGLGLMVSGNQTRLSVQGLHLNVQAAALIENGATLDLIGSQSSSTQLSVADAFLIDGTLRVGSNSSVLAGSSVTAGQQAGTTGLIDVSGANATLVIENGLDLGGDGNGRLDVTQGGLVQVGQSLRLGSGLFSTGELHISGANSRVDVDGSVESGFNGFASIAIANGGSLYSQSGFLVSNINPPNVSVAGQNSLWMMTGHLTSLGDTQILNGGAIVSQTASLVGGITRVQGFGSRLQAGDLQVGGFPNTPILEVTNGGLLETGTVSIGLTLNADGTVIVADGAHWNATNGAFVGTEGNGTVRLQSGATAHVGLLRAGVTSMGDGTINVSGSGSHLQINDSADIGIGGAGRLEIVQGGRVSVANHVNLGVDNGASGTITVDGVDSRLDVGGGILAGYSGAAFIEIANGGVVTSQSATFLDFFLPPFITIEGNGSRWDVAGGATFFDGSLDVSQGGTWTSDSLVLLGGSVAVGNASSSLHTQVLDIGAPLIPATLSVYDGALLQTHSARIGSAAGTFGSINLSQGGQWTAQDSLSVGFNGNGSVLVQSGSQLQTLSTLFVGHQSGSSGQIEINGNSALLALDGITYVGFEGLGSLQVTDGGAVRSTNLIYVGFGSGSDGLVRIQGPNSILESTEALSVGGNGLGRVEVLDGGVLETAFGLFGSGIPGSYVYINGPGSLWQVSQAINSTGGAIFVSQGGRVATALTSMSGGGILVEGSGSYYETGGLQIGLSVPESASVHVSDFGSLTSSFMTIDGGSLSVRLGNAQNSGSLQIGGVADGFVTLEDGGYMETGTTSLGGTLGGFGLASVWGSGSQLQIDGDLNVGVTSGSGSLTIANGGRVNLVAPGSMTHIGAGSAVQVNQGQFDFSRMNLESWGRISGTGGRISGLIVHDGYTEIAAIAPAFAASPFDVTQVRLENSGTLYGDGSLAIGLLNTVSGELEIRSGERLRLAGLNNVNAGEINNFGGQIRFDHSLNNLGFIGGRGEFIANGGWDNSGVMAFSGGNADLLGDINLAAGGRIVTTGGGTTTFFDDVLHNGAEIRTSLNSHSVFLGSVSGGGNYTGLGTVYFEGDLRPGNSPDVVSFSGDLVFGDSSSLFIELGGLGFGDFDQLLVGGDLTLAGDLFVNLINGHQLGANQQYLIADVGGNLSGFWNGLGEGALIGNFGGRDLFISYSAGNGNDIALFTAIPEPAVACLAAAFTMGLMVRRSRRLSSV